MEQLTNALPTYTHPAVLVVDEVGYLTYGTDAADMLFHVVTERHRRHRPMILTTNKSLKAWGRVLHDEDLAQAIIDRVLERARLLRLDGPSVRTLHVNLDDAMKEDSDQAADLVRLSGKSRSEFPEPTRGLWAAADEHFQAGSLVVVGGVDAERMRPFSRRLRGGQRAVEDQPDHVPSRGTERQPDADLRGVNYFCRSTTTISAGEGLAKEHRWRPQRNSVIVAGRSRAMCERCLSSS